MKSVLIWCLRITATVLGAVGAVLAVVAAESDWPTVDSVRIPIEHNGLAAVALSLVFIACAAILPIASSPRRGYSAQLRLVTALIAITSIGAFAFHYASSGGRFLA